MGSPVDIAALPLICPQGHGPGAAGSRFCTFCGSPLVPSAGLAQPAPAATIPPAAVIQPAVPAQAGAAPSAWGWEPVSASPPNGLRFKREIST